MDTLEQIAQDWFASMYAKDLTSERFLTLSQAERDALTSGALERTKELVARTVERLNERDIKLVTGATFHPDNKYSRRIFALVTGQQLPKGANDTHSVVLAYVGQEKLDALRQEREDKERKRQEEQDARQREINERIVARIRAGESVSGEELADAVRYLNIPAHPRTIGTLRKRVLSINADSAKVYKTKTKGQLSNEPYNLYAACKGANA
jgi:protein required for attachment to host cells